MKAYIQAISQISIQEPLCDNWFHHPIIPQSTYNESLEPDYKKFLAPMESRRMGKLLKRSIVTSLHVLRKAGCDNVDAIVSGTGLGCIDNTEKFLHAIIDNDEECLPPTAFMQSTHNTISSQIALYLKCHGYNCTYSHRGISFESSLLDAFAQMQAGDIHTALVGGHDEMTPDYFNMLNKIGYWKKEAISVETLRKSNTIGSFSGSCSLSLLLTDSPSDRSLCQLKAMEILYTPSMTELNDLLQSMLTKTQTTIEDIDAIVMGINGDKNNDAVYLQIAQNCFSNLPIIWYKHLFGESYSASAFGTYVAANCLNNNIIPEFLLYNEPCRPNRNVKNILVYNHFQNKDHSLILLSK